MPYACIAQRPPPHTGLPPHPTAPHRPTHTHRPPPAHLLPWYATVARRIGPGVVVDAHRYVGRTGLPSITRYLTPYPLLLPVGRGTVVTHLAPHTPPCRCPPAPHTTAHDQYSCHYPMPFPTLTPPCLPCNGLYLVHIVLPYSVAFVRAPFSCLRFVVRTLLAEPFPLPSWTGPYSPPTPAPPTPALPCPPTQDGFLYSPNAAFAFTCRHPAPV